MVEFLLVNLNNRHMHIPKVSIIVPIYKVERYLDRCMNSLLNQTLHDIEIILVDDGSPDNCVDCQPQIVQKLFSQTGRLKLNRGKITKRAMNTVIIEPMDIIFEI